MSLFASAVAQGDPGGFAAALVSQIRVGPHPTLGIVYVNEPAAAALPQLTAELTSATGIRHWVGGVGLGLLAPEGELYESPAAAMLVAALPQDGFCIFGATGDPAADIPRHHAAWIERTQPSLALVHADPRCPDVLRAVLDTASATGAFLVGGLTSHRCMAPLLARAPSHDGSGEAGISGLLLSPEIAVATGLTQGCSPIGPTHRIDEARDNVIMAIDGKPALTVFRDDIGPALAQDMRRLGNLIFAGLPITGSDTGDYLVRNLIGIDPRNGWMVLGAEVAPGDPILFCRRDPDSARRDMQRMLNQLAARLPGPAKAGIYVGCVARGAALFGEAGVEAAMIRETLGDFPLLGFFANGEISRDRLYGHTGVLTLFT